MIRRLESHVAKFEMNMAVGCENPPKVTGFGSVQQLHDASVAAHQILLEYAKLAIVLLY
jgi:hypothetical protein